MPDITMCKGYKCRQRTRCYRHNATPSEFRQSYFAEPPYHHLDECTQFWLDDTQRSFGGWLDQIYPGIRVRLSEGASTLLTRAEFEAALETLTEEGPWPR